MDTAKWATLLKAAPMASKLHGGTRFEHALDEEITKKDVDDLTQDEAERVLRHLNQKELVKLIKKFDNEQFHIMVVKAKPKMLKFIKKLTTLICKEALKSDFRRSCLRGLKIPKQIILDLIASREEWWDTDCILDYIDSELIDEEIAKAAFANNKLAIRCIKNPSQEMINISILSKERKAITYLVYNDLLNEEQLRLAIKTVPPVIEHIKNLTPELVTYAITCGLHDLSFDLKFKIPQEFEIILVRGNVSNLEHLFEPDNTTVAYAATKDPYLIFKSQKYPYMLSERAQEATVVGNPSIIFNLPGNVSDKVIQTAIRKNPYIVTYGSEKDIFKTEHILAAIAQEPKVLNAMVKVPNEVQLDIIKQNPERIKDIKNPSKEAICLYMSLVSGNIIMNPDIDFDVPDALSKYFK